MIFTAQRIGTQGFLALQTLIISLAPQESAGVLLSSLAVPVRFWWSDLSLQKEVQTSSFQSAKVSRYANDWPLWPKIALIGVSIAMETPPKKRARNDAASPDSAVKEIGPDNSIEIYRYLIYPCLI